MSTNDYRSGMNIRIPLVLLGIMAVLLVILNLLKAPPGRMARDGACLKRPEVIKPVSGYNREELIREIRKRHDMLEMDEKIINMYTDGMSIEEIAETLGPSVSKRRVRQAFARKGPLSEWKD